MPVITQWSPNDMKSFLDIPTPALVLKSQYGSLPLTPKDLALEIEGPYLAQIDASDMLGKPFGNMALRNQIKYPETQINIISARGMDPSLSSASAGGLSVDTAGGRKTFSVSDYAERCALEQPAVVIAMADEANHVTSNKRWRKASQTSELWFDTLRASTAIDWSSTYFMCVLNNNLERYEKGVAHTEDVLLNMISKGAQGVVLAGYGQGESLREKRIIVELVRRVVDSAGQQGKLSEEGKRNFRIMVQGVNDVKQILEAIELGIDLIATDLPRVLTTMGCAFAHSFGPSHATANTSNDSENSECSAPAPKRARIDNDDAGNSGRVEVTDFYINIRDKCFVHDKTPLIEGCSCHACRHHTRGYIHHLIMCHELLGEVLLQCHNHHCTMQLFKEARERLANGTFQQWKESL